MPLTQEDTGMSARSRVTVTRVLEEEQRRCTVGLARGRVTLLDSERLARRCLLGTAIE